MTTLFPRSECDHGKQARAANALTISVENRIGPTALHSQLLPHAISRKHKIHRRYR
jgi:hypothetical protein